MSKCWVFRILKWKLSYWTALRPKDCAWPRDAARLSAPSRSVTRAMVFMSQDYARTAGSATRLDLDSYLNVQVPTVVQTSQISARTLHDRRHALRTRSRSPALAQT